MLKLAVLGSGSSGNCALVCLGETRILIDAGLSAKQICLRLEALGIDPDSLSAIVLTHEHGDHISGVDVFCRKRSLPIYATTHTGAIVSEKVKAPVTWHQFEAGAKFAIGDIKIGSFSVPHDAVDPVGFVFDCGKSRIGLLSDVGHVTRMIVDHLEGVDTLFTEANYDEVMLQNDTKRPWSTKQRISNRHGHLSNDQTADLVKQIASPNLKRVILGHLSSDCNTSELAVSVIQNRLTEAGHTGIEVECADRKDPLPLREAAHAASYEARKIAELALAPETVSIEVKKEYQQTEWVF